MSTLSTYVDVRLDFHYILQNRSQQMSNTEADKRMQRFSVKHDRNKNEKNNAILFLVLEDRVFLKSVIYVNMLRVQNPKTRTGGVAQSTASAKPS
jgi:hypothetical protein